MGKYLAPAVFILLLGLCVAAYAFLAFELDGSTITTKQHVTQPQLRPKQE
jgi:hypothetical protein